MSLQTNLRGLLRNTFLPKSHGLLPVFEAIVNSIHSIEEKGNIKKGKITLSIIRTPQIEIDMTDTSTPPIIKFIVSDNGCGFNDINFNSFQTLDSEHKVDKGCRGVGRLLWLKAFDYVRIKSVFQVNSEIVNKRSFLFSKDKGVHDERVIKQDKLVETGSVIELNGFNAIYRKSVYQDTKNIVIALLEHCLWYYIRNNNSPEIYVEDGDDRYSLCELFYQHMHTQASSEIINILDQPFELTHIKFREFFNKKHTLAFCACNRLVKEESIQNKLLGLYQKLSDESGQFTYTCYVSSTFLDKNVRSERTSFDIAEEFDGLFEEQEISLKKIRQEILTYTQIYLQDALNKNISDSRRRIEQYISEKAPRYQSITKYISHDDLIIDPNKSDTEVELHLHEKWYSVERGILAQGQQIMKPKQKEQAEEYEKRIKRYLEKVEDLKKSDLANYICHRKIIIDLLEKSISHIIDGQYLRENIIHELIMPMGKTSADVFLDSCNLWLIDERLAFHHYLASDKSLSSMPIIDTNSKKEPDLIAFNVYDNPILVSDNNSTSLSSITIIEIKRPMRNDAKAGEDKDPIEQSLGYLHEIRNGGVKTLSDRPIPKYDNIPGYCYIIADLTPSLIRRCKFIDLMETHDHMGYCGYHKTHKSYIEVISFDRLVKMAKERNRAFFDKLGLPIS